MVHEKTLLTSPLEYWHYLDRPETFVRHAIASDMQSRALITAAVLGSQTMRWGGCSRYCDSGSLKIWYDLRYIVPTYPTVLMESGAEICQRQTMQTV